MASPLTGKSAKRPYEGEASVAVVHQSECAMEISSRDDHIGLFSDFQPSSDSQRSYSRKRYKLAYEDNDSDRRNGLAHLSQTKSYTSFDPLLERDSFHHSTLAPAIEESPGISEQRPPAYVHNPALYPPHRIPPPDPPQQNTWAGPRADDQQTLYHAPQVSINSALYAESQPPPTFSPHQHAQADPQTPQWNVLEIINMMTFRGQTVRPVLRTDFENGFFLSGDAVWTTYRRSYFALSATFSIDAPGIEFYRKGDIRIILGNGQEKIVGDFVLKLTAEVDPTNSQRKPIELIHHTPKRDKGPSFPPTLFHVLPSGALYLDEQLLPSTVQWERIQFKSATANNGKRRAQQQYYHLVVGLFANTIEEGEDSASICIARRISHPLVVRGRSPSHYHNKGPHNDPQKPWNSTSTAPAFPSGSPKQQWWTNQGQYHGVEPPGHDNTATTVPRAQYSSVMNHPMIVIEPKHPATLHRLSEVRHHDNLTTNPRKFEGISEYSRWEPTTSMDGAQVALPDPIIQDDSSISSHDTQRYSFSVMGTLSTASSVEHTAQALDLVLEFIRLRGIEKLCKDCIAVSTPGRCERNFRRLLKSFGTRLTIETKEEADRMVARVFRKHSSTIASRITELCRAHSSATKFLPLPSNEPHSEFSLSRYLAEHDAINSEPASVPIAPVPFSTSSDTESDEENPVDGTMESDVQDMQQSERSFSVYLDFLRNSEAIEDLREDLLDFRVALENTKNKLVMRSEQDAANEKGPETMPFPSPTRTTCSIWRRLKENIWERFRPSVRPGYRRLSWRCDCGSLLYADLDNTDTEAVDALVNSLSNPKTTSHEPVSTEDNRETVTTRNANVYATSNVSLGQDLSNTESSTAARATPNASKVAMVSPTRPPKYLAICVSTNRIYKTLIEIDVTDLASDAGLFAAMKRQYRAVRGYKAHFPSLFKPISVEFVHFSLWNIRHGLVSICDRPECVPPPTAQEYEFIPKPLRPLPPMPPEIFIHYLEHGDGDLLPTRCDWLPRLPKRLDGRMIDKNDGPCYGWGIYIKEGPNRDTIFWLVIVTVLGSVILSICWSALQKDVQGGSGLGTLVMTLPTVVMGAFVFRFTNHN